MREKKYKRYRALPEKGLTTEQVVKRIDERLINIVPNYSKSYLSIIIKNTFSFFNFIFFGLAAWLIYVEAYSDLVFMSVVLTNLGIGIIQEIRAKKAVDNLSIINSPTSLVVRDGIKRKIPAEEIVLDDIIILSAGNQIPVDATIIDGEIEVIKEQIYLFATKLDYRDGTLRKFVNEYKE